jgi:glutamate-1-semialdehyde 2,1-aminomutase
MSASTVAATTDARFELSTAHARAAHRIIPGGAHALAKGDDQYPEDMAPIIVAGSGCRVRDLDDNELIEYGIGLRSVTLGHGDQRILSPVKAALDSGVNFARPHVLERRAAERLLELFPFADMVKFGVNGSDATSAAVKVARAFTGRDRIAVCADHAMFGTADWFICTTPMSAGIPLTHQELTASFRYNDLDSVEAVLNSAPGEFAALVLEAETTVPPQPGFFEGLRALCNRYGTLLILDEIITGFRWHERGAQFVHGITPDLCTLGKGLANGLPLSALLGRREIMDLGGFAPDRDRVFLLSQTYGAQPWVLAAMLAVIDTYESDAIVARLHAAGSRLRQGVESVVSARALGPYIQVVGRDCNLVFATRDSSGERSQGFRTLFLQELLRRRILAPSFVVSAAHDDDAIDQTVLAVEGALPAYERALEEGLETVLHGRHVKPTIRRRW